MTSKRLFLKLLFFVLLLAALPALALAQDEAPAQQAPIETDDNTPGTAIPLSCGGSQSGGISSAGDVDYYKIETGASSSIIVTIQAQNPGILDSVLDLYGANGATFLTNNDDFDGLDARLHWTPQFDASVPSGSRQYVRVRDFNNAGGSNYGYTIRWDHPRYVSMTTSGMAGGVAYDKGDILVYYFCQSRWEKVFDASDVFLPGNVRDFAFSNGLPSLVNRHGHIFMALDKQTVPGVGPVMANDLIAFRPDNLGEETAGNFYWLFDGSDVGLTTKNERIDGLALIGDNLLLSTNGAGSVPPTGSFQDEDILILAPFVLGAETRVTWGSVVYFDGSDVGVSGVDVQGIWAPSAVTPHSYLVTTFDKPVTLGGIPFQPYMANRCTLISVGANTNCNWTPWFFNGFGLPTSAVLDGYDEGTAWWPAGFTPFGSQAVIAKPAQE